MKQILILILSSTILVTMNAQTLQGNHWTAKSVEGAYIVSIEDRASILGALTGFITSQKIQAGQVTGIGATNEATLRFFDPSRKDYTALAGHLLDAKIRGAGEFFVYPINSKVFKVKNEDVGLYFYDFAHQ